MKIITLISLVLLLAGNERRDVRILGKDKGEIIMAPHVPPVIFVRQTAGDPLPEKGSISCHWNEEKRDKRPVIIGDCEHGVKLEMTGIDLNF